MTVFHLYMIFVDFCKKISEKREGAESSDDDHEMYTRRDSEDESFTNHPFKLKDSQAPIVMNIRVRLKVSVCIENRNILENNNLKK